MNINNHWIRNNLPAFSVGMSVVNALLLWHCIIYLPSQQADNDDDGGDVVVIANTDNCRYDSFSAIDYQGRVKWLNQYLAKHHAASFEGHSAQIEAQWTIYTRLFSRCSVHSIAEIGFNAGHSTLAMLMSNPHLKIQSFDLGTINSARPALDVLKKHFPLRDFNVVWGDSTRTVPQFAAAHAGTTFDIVIVDGGHSYDVAYADVVNMKKLSRADTILIVDDTVCEADYCVDKVLNELSKKGVIEITEQIPFEDGRGMSLARYVWP
jgi:predicted O-methyltransferase YrrM